MSNDKFAFIKIDWPWCLWDTNQVCGAGDMGRRGRNCEGRCVQLWRAVDWDSNRAPAKLADEGQHGRQGGESGGLGKGEDRCRRGIGDPGPPDGHWSTREGDGGGQGTLGDCAEVYRQRCQEQAHHGGGCGHAQQDLRMWKLKSRSWLVLE